MESLLAGYNSPFLIHHRIPIFHKFSFCYVYLSRQMNTNYWQSKSTNLLVNEGKNGLRSFPNKGVYRLFVFGLQIKNLSKNSRKRNQNRSDAWLISVVKKSSCFTFGNSYSLICWIQILKSHNKCRPSFILQKVLQFISLNHHLLKNLYPNSGHHRQ